MEAGGRSGSSTSRPRGCATRSSMLKRIQSSQSMTRNGDRTIDAVAHRRATAASTASRSCFVRGGRNLGSQQLLPEGRTRRRAEVLGAFLAQYYLAREAPAEIVVDRAIEDARAARAGAAASEPVTPVHDPQQRPRHARALARDGAQRMRRSGCA